ncbi:MAG: glycosyltransferase family 39 protein [Bacteroidales bacterium]|nr:glycosyltransferase family 39 protein [Bacteroidales bacterium]
MNRRKSIRISILFFIGVISFFMHFKYFKEDIKGIHVWRQTQTQSTIINFYEEDMNILNPRRNDRGDTDGIFRMEFPLMQWLVACSYKIFGNHLWICRILMFLTGIFSTIGIYKLLSALFDNDILSLIGAWAFTFSPVFYYYTINPMPDNLALCCSIWGMALFFKWTRNNRLSMLLLSGLLLSLGALCKLPFIIYYAVPFVHFFPVIIKNGIDRKSGLNMVVVFGFIVFPAAWYLTIIPQWKGNIIVKGMLSNEESFSQILDYLQHNLISTLPELLLNYGSVIFFLAGFYFLFRRKAYNDSRFPLLLTWGTAVVAYYLFEVNAIKKVHDYYLFPFLPLLFIIVSYGAYNLFNQSTIGRYITILLLLLLPVTCHLRIQGRWHPEKLVFNEDLITYKQELRNAVPGNSLVVAGNDESRCIFFYHIGKKGWGFDNNNLTAPQLLSMIEKGAEYLYSDSRMIDENEDIKPMLKELILETGSVRVYVLQKPSP